MYLELIIITDFIMNYLVLISTGIILNRITKYKCIFLSSIIGIIPLIFINIINNRIILFIINIIFSLIMAIISFNYKNIIYTIKNIIYMYFISIFLAGSIYLINTSFFPHVSNQALSLIILVTLSPIISFIYIKNIKKIRVVSSNYYKVSIYLKDKPKIDLIMYLDTGNILFDPYNHKPIILISKKIIPKIPSKYILVPYNTIDSHNLLKCFSPDKLFIEGIGFIKNVLIGLIDDVKIDGADGILNVSILERMTIC